MIFETLVLGTSSATIAHGRGLTSQVLNANGHLYLIDCGEGTQFQLVKYGIRSTMIRCIFISHLHGDHYYGLMGLLTTMSLKGREAPLHLFGPAGLGECVALHLRLSGSVLSYQISFHPIAPGAEERIYADEGITVETVALEHRIPCSGFIFRENVRSRRFIGEKMPKGFPTEKIDKLKLEEDVEYQGVVYKWEEMTLPPKPSRSYAFCTDTRYLPDLAPKLRGVDVLYHEATYMNEHKEKAFDHHHCTAGQAGLVAREAGVKALLIGHYSSRYGDLHPLLQEAAQVFPASHLAIEGSIYGMHWKGDGYVFGKRSTN